MTILRHSLRIPFYHSFCGLPIVLILILIGLASKTPYLTQSPSQTANPPPQDLPRPSDKAGPHRPIPPIGSSARLELPIFRTAPQLATMAWRSSGTTNGELIHNLFRNGLISSPRVRDAMIKVDRAHYCANPSVAYQDSPQSIGHAATISAPHMHASAAESLLPLLPLNSARPLRVLDIGSGSGYLTHVLAELVGEEGKVVGVEHIKELRDLGERNMGKSEEGRRLLRMQNVRFVVGDGRKGWIDEGEKEGEEGWDAIHVGAAAARIHDELVKQLRQPGR